MATKKGEAEQQVALHNNTLTVRIKNAPLHWLLSELSKQSQIPIHVSKELILNHISAELDHIPLLEGLPQLLHEFDIFFFFGASDHSSTSLKAIWVYPKRKGESLAPIPMTAGMNNEVIREIPNFAAQAGMQSLDPVIASAELTRASQSAEAPVRFSAIAASLENKIELPVNALQQLASTDPDQKVRGLALTALTQNSTADASLVRTAAQIALRDSDPEIRAQAKGTLENLELAERPNEGISQPQMQQE